MNETIIKIRQELFAFRNGVVAEQIRRTGDPHTIILGCLLPDIMQIAKQFTPSADLASALWMAKKHRECRMIATMLYPAENFDIDTAIAWAHDVETTEIADILCLKLLRHATCATSLWKSLLLSDSELVQYTGLRLLVNLMNSGKITPSIELKSQLHEISATGIMKPVMAQISEEFASVKNMD